jgi:hypothetical protein
VKQERLDWLAVNPHYTHRFALYVGKQCRSTSIKEVATDLHLDWHAVKEMDKLDMREQLARAGEPRPGVIGIDELAIRKGHVYRIVVSDWERQQPIWFGGVDRSEESLAMFYDFLGDARTQQIRLAVMDMWKAFRNATEAEAPQAAILYDKFHVLRHLNEAMDQVRKAEYKRLTNRPDRTYIVSVRAARVDMPQARRVARIERRCGRCDYGVMPRARACCQARGSQSPRRRIEEAGSRETRSIRYASTSTRACRAFSTSVKRLARRGPASGCPMKSQLRAPSLRGRMVFSAGLLWSEAPGVVTQRSSEARWPRR